jgi:hypothetical protein
VLVPGLGVGANHDLPVRDLRQHAKAERQRLRCPWNVAAAAVTNTVAKAGPALLGYPDPRERSPGLAPVVAAFNLALPMRA